ncbi:putative membrane spanning protein [Bifidobacterium breve 31L]|nr:putative membrane spanning protein [Bifidobacterium breve 31L]
MMSCFTAGSLADEQLFSRSVSMLMLMLIPFICELFSKEITKEKVSLPIALVCLGAIVIFVDNLRAGVRFQNIVFFMDIYCSYRVSIHSFAGSYSSE